MQTQVLLLVEDELAIQALLEDALTEGGFEVTVAENGKKAFAEFETDATRFRAVITDIRLGSGPDGWEIGHRVRELVPAMPVIYMSGDSAADWASKGVPNSIMVAKPFAVAQMVTAVAHLLIQADSHPRT
jgi:DNA-binding NtrC family response regulator